MPQYIIPVFLHDNHILNSTLQIEPISICICLITHMVPDLKGNLQTRNNSMVRLFLNFFLKKLCLYETWLCSYPVASFAQSHRNQQSSSGTLNSTCKGFLLPQHEPQSTVLHVEEGFLPTVPLYHERMFQFLQWPFSDSFFCIVAKQIQLSKLHGDAERYTIPSLRTDNENFEQ